MICMCQGVSSGTNSVSIATMLQNVGYALNNTRGLRPINRMLGCERICEITSARLSVLAALVGSHDKHQTHEYCDSTIDGPSDLSGHKTTGQDIDALKEPNGPHQHDQNANDFQNDSHRSYPRVIVPVAFEQDKIVTSKVLMLVALYFLGGAQVSYAQKILSADLTVEKQEVVEVRGDSAYLSVHTKIKFVNQGSSVLILSRDSNRLPIRYLISASRSDAQQNKFESVEIPFMVISGTFDFDPLAAPPNQWFVVLKPGDSLELPYEFVLPGRLSGPSAPKAGLVFDGKEHFLQLELTTFPYADNSPTPDCNENCRTAFEQRWKSIGTLWSKSIRTEPAQFRLTEIRGGKRGQ
jgi:hypothetical protein